MKIEANLYEGANFCLRCGAKLEIKKDRENKLRPICPVCGWTMYLNPIPAAVCVIPNDEREICLIKRKFAPNPGAWALPSGYIEINQTPAQAAVEEMKEETNLTGQAGEYLGYFVGPSPIYHRIFSFGYVMKNLTGKPKAGDDAVDIKFVSLETDFSFIPFSSHRYFLKRYKLKYCL